MRFLTLLTLSTALAISISALSSFAARQHPSLAPNPDCSGPDTDGDGVPHECDLCLGYDDRRDVDGDGVPDGCDMCPEADDAVDVDRDGVPDGCDLCVGGDDAFDEDDDGLPDACDRCAGSPDSVDDDRDHVPDGCDVCPSGDDSVDADLDGVPDACDVCEGHADQLDRDSDGIADGCDECPGVDDRTLSRSDLVVCFKDGLLGVQTRKRSLGDVLGEMADQAAFAMYLPDTVAARIVSVSFEPLPVEQAVRRVLQGTSFTVRYSRPDGARGARSAPGSGRRSGPAHLAEIRVLGADGIAVASASNGRQAGAMASTGRGHDDLLEAARNGSDAVARAEAIGLLVRSDRGVETRRTVISALQDPAAEVRRAALEAAVELGSGAGTSAIARIARNDADPDLRMQALRTLVEHDYPRGTAIAIVEIAVRDRDSRVATLARELKAELGRTQRR